MNSITQVVPSERHLSFFFVVFRSAQLMHHLTKNPQYVVRQYSWFRDNPPLEVTSRFIDL